jgi:hypothetical protein
MQAAPGADGMRHPVGCGTQWDAAPSVLGCRLPPVLITAHAMQLPVPYVAYGARNSSMHVTKMT